MSNPSIIHRLLGVIHRFGTLPPKQNLPIQDVQPALISARHPSDCRPYSSDNRQVKGQNRPTFLFIRQLIVNQYAVIVKWINGSNQPIIDRRDIIIDRPAVFRAPENRLITVRCPSFRAAGVVESWFFPCSLHHSNTPSLRYRYPITPPFSAIVLGVDGLAGNLDLTTGYVLTIANLYRGLTCKK